MRKCREKTGKRFLKKSLKQAFKLLRERFIINTIAMKYYSDSFMYKSNPSPIGGGYTVTDEIGNLIHREVIKKEGLTNNEAETRGILHAMEIAEHMDSVSTDSMCCLTWVRKGRAKARPDLFNVLQRCKFLLQDKELNLMWEAREFNLAGIMNQSNQETRKKYKAYEY